VKSLRSIHVLQLCSYAVIRNPVDGFQVCRALFATIQTCFPGSSCCPHPPSAVAPALCALQDNAHIQAQSKTKMDCVHCSHLPQSVLVHILQHVPLQARLQHCALVSTAWAAAAAAATTHLTHRFPATAEAGHAKSMLRWIAKHGQEITSLQLLGRDRGLVLPFSRQLLPNLRCLAIQDLAVFVGSFSGRPADAVFISAAATAAPPAAAAAAAGAGRHMPQTSVPLLLASKQLTRLELVNCRLLPQAQALPSLTVLSVLTDLQHLKLAVQSGDGVQGWSWNELVAQQERMQQVGVAHCGMLGWGAAACFTGGVVSLVQAGHSDKQPPLELLTPHLLLLLVPLLLQQVLAGMWSSLTRLTHLDLSRQVRSIALQACTVCQC
jgi:hypothetical protein